MKEKIINEAEQLFMQYGIKSVTMDDIAKHLSMSKKTIYQYFKDKNEIVCLVTKGHLDRESHEIAEILKNASNSVQVFFEISKCVKKNVSGMNPSVLYDLQKYHYKAWKFYEAFKEETVTKAIEETLRRGIKEGDFRTEINPELLAIFRSEHVQMAFNLQLFPRDKFSFMEIQEQFLGLFLHGILTKKGRGLWNSYLSNNSN